MDPVVDVDRPADRDGGARLAESRSGLPDARRCVNTPDMVNNLDDAPKALGWPTDYQYINIGKLPANDARTGYPTPTLLWNGKDIFGMPAPAPPFHEPS